MAPKPNRTINNSLCLPLATEQFRLNPTLKINDTSVYNPKVDPCNPKYDASMVDQSKIMPVYGTKYQYILYQLVSLVLNWLPFIVIMDCVIGAFWCPNDRYFTSQWGMLKVMWKTQPSIYIVMALYYVAIVGSLLFMLKYIKSKLEYSNTFLQSNISSKFNNNTDTSAILKKIHQLFPSTTRVITDNNMNRSDILIIGTSHLSESSGKQVKQLIELLEQNVKSVVLELDEARYLRMRSGDLNPSLYQATLARDLLRISTYLDPITLFARIGTNLTAYFMEPGMEFRQAANVAIERNLEIVYGDQELEKTVSSIGKNTPKWLAVLLNILLLTSYGFPVISAISHLAFVFTNDSWINLFTKIFAATIVWNALYYPIYLLIRVFTEQSKLGNGMKRLSKTLTILSKILPCVANVFKKSDFKTVRDKTLAMRTLKTANKYDSGTVVVAVVGLAHMSDMADIITTEM